MKINFWIGTYNFNHTQKYWREDSRMYLLRSLQILGFSYHYARCMAAGLKGTEE